MSNSGRKMADTYGGWWCAHVLPGQQWGGPLFGMMGFSSMLASATLVLIRSPLMVIFIPELFCSGLILMAANRDSYWLVSTLGWIFQQLRSRRPIVFGVADKDWSTRTTKETV